ncbi:flagellar biosynthesis protein FliQ [bacterium]|nr:flagellar biosynthesis protein FliQ [bacterium]MBU1983824.1 flagellar biosynthesis protein FliQ [bacterium]
MTQEMALFLTTQALTVALKVSAPMLVAGLIIGIAISIFQAVTQINEMTLAFIPKIVVTALVLLLTIPWMAAEVTDFFRYIFSIIPEVAR